MFLALSIRNSGAGIGCGCRFSDGTRPGADAWKAKVSIPKGMLTLREIPQQFLVITKCALQKKSSTVEYRHTVSTLRAWHYEDCVLKSVLQPDHQSVYIW